MSRFVVVALLGIFIIPSQSLDNGLALTPPMGWMHWQRYRCNIDCELYPDECISEKMFRNVADIMVADGYLAAGYEYIVIDDCWMESKRDENGVLQPDKFRFPNGMKALADYIHSKGLKFGIYQNYGTKTCELYPGLIGYLEIDANTFASWDIDYIKIDGCHSDITTSEAGYSAFGQFLNATGRPIVYSCSWPMYQEINGMKADYAAVAKHCNLWRNYGDISDNWGTVLQILDWSAKNQDRFIPHSGPGHWTDPDMLLLGNFGLTYDQSKAQMALWAVMASPLIMSNDLKKVRPEIRDILQNREIISINKDELGIHGKRVYKKNDIQIWIKPILPRIGDFDSYAIVVLNRKVNYMPEKFSLPLKELGLKAPKYRLNDLYEPDNSLKDATDTLDVYVNPTGVVMLRAEPSI